MVTQMGAVTWKMTSSDLSELPTELEEVIRVERNPQSIELSGGQSGHKYKSKGGWHLEGLNQVAGYDDSSTPHWPFQGY